MALGCTVLALAMLFLLPGCGGGGGSNGIAAGPGSSTADQGALGSLGRGYLRSSPYTKIVVEIDLARGVAAPSQTALDQLQSILQKYCDKPGGITFAPESQFDPPQATYTADDIRALAGTVQKVPTSGDTAVIHFLYLNGSYQDPNVLAVAVGASTVGVFPERISAASTLVVTAPAIERAVLVHETGHLFGLVNITYHSTIDHEDAQHPHHDINQNCVMYYAVEDISVAAILNLGPPADFDSACQQDLQALKQP